MTNKLIASLFNVCVGRAFDCSSQYGMAIDQFWVPFEPGSSSGLKTRDRVDALPIQKLLLSVWSRAAIRSRNTKSHSMVRSASVTHSCAMLR